MHNCTGSTNNSYRNSNKKKKKKQGSCISGPVQAAGPFKLGLVLEYIDLHNLHENICLKLNKRTMLGQTCPCLEFHGK